MLPRNRMRMISIRKTRLQTAACFVFLLLLTYGFPVTGDDWFFTLRQPDVNPLHALRIGIDTAVSHWQTTNGRCLGNFLAGAAGTSKLLRELLRSGILFGIFLAVCRFCRLRSGAERLVCMALLVAVPADIFAETYAWAAGFFNYAPPTLLVLLYLAEAGEQLVQGKRRSFLCTLGLFLLGLCTQFFVENVTVAMCLLSAGLCLADGVRKKRLAPQLAAHAAGALLGCVLMFLAPGYRNIGQEAYREIPQGISALIGNAVTNFGIIVNKLMLKNWLCIGLLTLSCFLLLLRVQPDSRKTSQRCSLTALSLALATIGLIVCPVLLAPLLTDAAASRAAMLLQLLLALAALLWLVSVAVSILLGIPEPAERLLSLLPLGAAVVFLAPLLAVHPIGPRCLYLADVLLLCTIFRLWRSCCRREDAPSALLRRCVCVCACAILGGFLWMMLCNGRFEAVRIAYTEQQLAAGATQIVLPDYPYSDYVYGADSPAIESYYARETPGDVTFSLVPYEDWHPEEKNIS